MARTSSSDQEILSRLSSPQDDKATDHEGTRVLDYLCEILKNGVNLGAEEVRRKGEETANIAQDRKERKSYAKRIFIFSCVYFGLVFLVLGLSKCLDISDGVLITLLGTTTANVLALLRFVARYLFSNNHKSS